jgi:hypothetical protein
MDVGTAVASAWSAGISMYGVLAFLGIAGRLEWITAPETLEQPWLIGVFLVLFAFEFVVDKIAFLDSGWDAVHTVLRPIAGGYITAVAPEQDLPLWVAAIIGGGLAFTAHSAKASTRALVNTSPEPVSNVFVSGAEDGLVAALMALAVAYPAAAFGVTVVLVVLSTLVAVVMARFILRLWRRFQAWRLRRAAKRIGGLGPAPP